MTLSELGAHQLPAWVSTMLFVVVSSLLGPNGHSHFFLYSWGDLNYCEMVMKFTRATKIITIGHLPGHTNGKVALLKEHGFTEVSSILCESMPVEEIKEILQSSPNSLFLVGGAMMKGFPDLMADLLLFISEECPTILVHKTVTSDFDADTTWPPTEEQVNKSALNICMRMLEHGDIQAS